MAGGLLPQGGAVFSRDRRYRYVLCRRWASGQGLVMFVGLNPSTADETQDDPTLRRCMGYAQDWGYAGLLMTNLFAWRATRPADLLAAPAPIGPRNNAWLRQAATQAHRVVAAWGAHGNHQGRAQQVQALPPPLHALRITQGGQPGHPLYLPKGLVPVAWQPARD
jgi:hypothetical protein